ncbi:MAG: hypothetical protein NT022_10940 [Deltaproteobacteria bacterium]|nr:hypothetical protein [Deltaproteobacteria bacterium]
MVLDISIHERACQAFIEALRRSEGMFFVLDEIIISEKKKIGDPVVCAMDAQKGNVIITNISVTDYHNFGG